MPRKNLFPLAGRPLIAWTIDAALQAPSLARVIVSTDSEEIAEAASSLGVPVPFMRPESLAHDDTPGPQVILHAIQWLERHGDVPDYVVMLQPTSPLRTSGDIEAAIAIARDTAADSVVSVCPCVHHPLWTKRIEDDGTMTDYLPNASQYPRRQDLPPAYALNGALYLVRPQVLTRSGSFYGGRTFPYVMPYDRSIDIDTIEDMRMAEFLLTSPAPVD